MPPASRFVRLRAPLLACLALALAACDGADQLTNPAESPTETITAGPVSYASVDFRGGIPFGNFGQPTTEYGARFNGGVRAVSPNIMVRELAEIKSRGGRIVLNLGGGPSRYIDADGHFSLKMWKASVDRHKGIDFSSYIDDGTVIAHYLIDEPHDAANWNGQKVSLSTLEEMARYSKELWPNMVTVVRAYPDYLAGLSGKYRYLDAAWLQYVYRFGDVGDFTQKQVAMAQDKGLGLIAGLNILKGGPDKTPMTGSQLKSWGATLIGTSHVCAMISWTYDAQYLEQPAIKEAMTELANKAASRAGKSCRGTNGQTTGTAPEPLEPAPAPAPAPAPDPSSAPAPIQLKAGGITQKLDRYYVLLTWSGAAGSHVDLYRNGKLRRTTENTGRTSIIVDPTSRTVYNVQICEGGTTRCSNTATIDFR